MYGPSSLELRGRKHAPEAKYTIRVLQHTTSVIHLAKLRSVIRREDWWRRGMAWRPRDPITFHFFKVGLSHVCKCSRVSGNSTPEFVGGYFIRYAALIV